MLKPGRNSVREIGHFAAHRGERETGISLARANDIQISAKLWHRRVDGAPPNVDDLHEAAKANFNIMPEEQIRERLGISLQTAQQSFAKAIRKYERGHPLKKREREVLNIFGLSMMWQFALNDRVLSSDLIDLLILEDALLEGDRPRFESVSQFVSLYALSIMHGSRLKMADGGMAQLRLAAAESEGFLRIKAEIPISGTRKPVTSCVPLFETSLMASAHCDPEILNNSDNPVPIEIEGDQLVALF